MSADTTSPVVIRREVLLHMLNNGGGFVVLLAAAWLRADARYSAVLAEAFKDLYDQYAAWRAAPHDHRSAVGGPFPVANDAGHFMHAADPALGRDTRTSDKSGVPA